MTELVNSMFQKYGDPPKRIKELNVEDIVASTPQVKNQRKRK